MHDLFNIPFKKNQIFNKTIYIFYKTPKKIILIFILYTIYLRYYLQIVLNFNQTIYILYKKEKKIILILIPHTNNSKSHYIQFI